MKYNDIKVYAGQPTKDLVARAHLARISHSPGHHLGFGEDAECKSDEEGWAG
jgi:hypothetical protein